MGTSVPIRAGLRAGGGDGGRGHGGAVAEEDARDGPRQAERRQPDHAEVGAGGRAERAPDGDDRLSREIDAEDDAIQAATQDHHVRPSTASSAPPGTAMPTSASF